MFFHDGYNLVTVVVMDNSFTLITLADSFNPITTHFVFYRERTWEAKVFAKYNLSEEIYIILFQA